MPIIWSMHIFQGKKSSKTTSKAKDGDNIIGFINILLNKKKMVEDIFGKSWKKGPSKN